MHCNYFLVWLELTLKISDYWVQNDGSAYLPQQWVFYSQKLEKSCEVSKILMINIPYLKYFYDIELDHFTWNHLLNPTWLSVFVQASALLLGIEPSYSLDHT